MREGVLDKRPMFKCEPCPAGSACDINAVDKGTNSAIAATGAAEERGGGGREE